MGTSIFQTGHTSHPNSEFRNHRPLTRILPSTLRLPPSEFPVEFTRRGGHAPHPLHWIDFATSCLTTVAFHDSKPYVFQSFSSPIATPIFRARRKNIFRALPRTSTRSSPAAAGLLPSALSLPTLC